MAGETSGRTTAESDDPPAHVPRRHRADIDGLRAVAIVAVVAYHAGIPGASGGFVGVDVFFVISGFLITRNLIHEAADNGRIRLLDFWGRRIRRLVPALALMIVSVLALSVLVLNSLEWQAVARDGQASALYVSNLLFARDATDYFGGDVGSSLFLHTWSLGVEEQFYLVWPLLVGGLVWVAHRRPSRLRPALTALFTTVLVVSLWHSVSLTRAGSPHAFFGLPSRAWEFAAAGLIATLPVPRRLRGRPASAGLVVAGLTLIAVAVVGLEDSTRYPGFWPLLPVGGTLLVIIAGSAPASLPVSNLVSNRATQLLGARWLQWVGRVSYSWYLWHWPLILLAVRVADSEALWVTVGASLVALIIGAGTHIWLENPVRFDVRLRRSLPGTLAMGASATVLVLVAGLALRGYSDAQLTELASASETPTVTLAEVRASQREFSCLDEPTTESGVSYCLDGDPDGAVTLLLVGDSHARHWKPVFAEVARQRGIRVVVRWRSVCPAFPVSTILIDGGSGIDLECQEFREDTDRLIDELQPDLTVIATSNDYGLLVVDDEPTEPPRGRAELWERAYDSFVTSLQKRGIAVGSIVDTPRNASDPLDCIAADGAEACATSRAEALVGDEYTLAEQAVRDRLGDIPALDLTDVLCDDDACPVMIDGQYVYTDVDHLYEPFTMTLTPRIDAFVQELLDGV